MVFDWRVSFRRPLSDAPALGIRPPRLPLLLAVAACSAQKAARRCALSGGRSIGRHHRPPAPRLLAGGAGGRRRRFLFVCALRLPRRWLPRFGAGAGRRRWGLWPLPLVAGRGWGLWPLPAARRPASCVGGGRGSGGGRRGGFGLGAGRRRWGGRFFVVMWQTIFFTKHYFLDKIKDNI